METWVNTYLIPHKFRTASLYALCFLALAIFLLIVGVLCGIWDGDVSGIILVIGCILLMSIIPLILLDFYHGEVILTDDEIIVRRWQREKRVRYQEVTATKQPLYNLPPEFSLWAGRHRVAIPTQIDEFPEIYAVLCEKVPVLRQEIQAGFPYRLSVSTRGWGLYFLGIPVLLVLWIGFTIMPFDYSRDSISGETVRTSLILFALLGFFFAPAIYIIGLGMVSGSLTFRQPVAWKFTSDEIYFRYAFGPWFSRPARELVHVELQPIPVTLEVSSKNFNLTEQARWYNLRLHFSGGSLLKMEINSDRAIQFGTDLMKISARLRNLYRLSDQQSKISTSRPVLDPEFGQRVDIELRVDPSISRNVTMGVLFLCGGGLFVWLIFLSFWIWPDSNNDIADLWNCWPIGLVFWGLGFLVYIAYYFPKQPSRWIFGRKQIRFRYPLGGWHTRDVRDLQKIALVPKSQTQFVPDGAGSHQATPVSVWHLVLMFRQGDELHITEDRLKQFGVTPQQLQAILEKYYPETGVL